MKAIMAARMAAIKQDEESQAGAGTGAAAAGAAGEKNGSENIAARGAQTQPAEQAGGEGETAAEAEKIVNPIRSEAPRSHPQHEWDEYGVLADRDMWDMSDEEKLRLEELHRRFDHAKAKKA